MFRTLRARLILSHVLPLVIIIPIMGLALTYLVETRVLLPSLSRALVGDAVLLSNIAGEEPNLWNNPVFTQYFLTNSQEGINARVQLISPAGQLLASSDPADINNLGMILDYAGISQARSGQVASYISNQPLQVEIIDVFVPVLNSNRQLLGILRMSYRYETIYGVFLQSRYLIIAILTLGLIIGSALGSALALNLSSPIRQVTQAIYDLAHGKREAQVTARGPEEIKLLAQAFNFLAERLNSLEKARQQLLANLVHELGRPLGALRSAIQALAGGAGHDPQLLEDLTTGMDEEAARLQHLLEDLAHLHDQVLGNLEMEFQDLALSEWLPKVVRPWQEAANEKRLTWQTEIPGDLPVISADPNRLAAAVENLVSNAIKYTPSNGSVTISAGVEGNEVYIQVSDNGPGIPLDEQEKIFQPFYRGNQGRRFNEGMGLGLSITRDLVNAHSGRLTLDSKPEQGSRFTIYLPLARE